MSGVCWGSLTPPGDRRSGCWGNKRVPFAPLCACFYLSEPTSPLFLLRRLDLLVVIPKSCFHCYLWPCGGSLSTNHELFFLFAWEWPFPGGAGNWDVQWRELWDDELVLQWLLPIWARPEQAMGWCLRVQKGFSLVTIIPCCTRHLVLLLWERKAERDGEQRDCSFFLSPGGCLI